jgi:hypothetical protein
MGEVAELAEYPGAIAWLRNSLQHRLWEAERNERRCRKAYRGQGGMRLAADLLADAHARAAASFREALQALGENVPPPNRCLCTVVVTMNDREIGRSVDVRCPEHGWERDDG